MYQRNINSDAEVPKLMQSINTNREVYIGLTDIITNRDIIRYNQLFWWIFRYHSVSLIRSQMVY